MNATTYSPEARTKALAALLTGERVCVVAREYGIPEGTVKCWRYQLRSGRMQPEKKGRIGDLLLEHTRATLRSLIAQSEDISEPSGLRQMGAGELGIFFGTLFDRTMRVWEVAGPLISNREGRHGEG